eukprot:PITA_14481
MANAFDGVNRSFLYKVLHSFGFSTHFVNIIIACTDNPWIAPLVNSRRTPFFQAQRGLRQECPLSPFLYILMVDSLSRKLSSKKASSSLPSLKPSNSSLAQNHALFADDSLLLGGASISIAKAFDFVLKCYCRVTRASINKSKSEVYGLNIGQQELTSISNILGFNGHAHWEMIKYLDLPITNGLNKRSLWIEIISKIKSKITAWGGYWLTKGGGKGNQHKIHLVKWDLVKRSIPEGGLQIRDPTLVNLAMGGKILWNLFKDPKHPVCEMLKSKYAHKVPLRNLQASQTINNTQVWKLCSKSLNFLKGKAYKIPGNGKHTNLWYDRIMDRDPLSEVEEIADLKNWLERAGINSMHELSKWDCHDDWQGWDFFGVPNRVNQQKLILGELLEEAAPVNRKTKDSWGWGQSGSYTTSTT